MNAALKKTLKPLALAALISAPVSQTALADGDWVMQPTPEYKSADGSFTFKLRGRVYWDQSWATDRNGTMDTTDNEFRAARFGFEGKLGSALGYKAEALLDGSEVDFTDLYLAYKGDVEVRLGNYKIATSLEESTSPRHITFMERGAITDAFGYSRGLGMSVVKAGEDWNLHFGAQKGNINDGASDGTVTIAGRFTKGLTLGDSTLHLGGSLRYREQDMDQSDLRYRQRPFTHLSDRFVNTGRIANRDYTYGLEAAFLKGSFAVQSEVAQLNAHLTAENYQQGNPTFKGGYVDFSWFATGEQRSYSASKGSFSGIKPINPTGEGGMGAFQFAVRLDTIDLNDEGIMGGSQTSVIAGMNWYPNRWTRMMVNYSTSSVKNGFLVAANGLTGYNKIKTFGVRLQVNW